MRIPSVLLSLFAAATLSANLAHAVPLVSNGSFERTTNQTNKQLSSRPSDDKHRTTMVGWTSSNGNDGGYNFVLDTRLIHTWDSAIWFKKYESDIKRGNVFASDALYHPGTLTQTITGLMPGAAYVLSFDYALGQQVGFDGANPNNYWQVGFGSSIRDAGKLSIENGGFSGWKTEKMMFTATSFQQALSFLALSSSPGAPPFMLLDNVSLREAGVPEPSSISMLLGGVCLLGFMARRKRARV